MSGVGLTVAGHDPSAGAGVLIDCFAFAALGRAPAAVVAALTAQNAARFDTLEPVSADMVRAQLSAVRSQAEPACAKVGVIGTAENAAAVAEELAGWSAPVAVDPVARSSSGGSLVDDAAAAADALATCATLLTPNTTEAGTLVGGEVVSVADAEEAAMALAARWHTSVVVTGLEGDAPGTTMDVLATGGRAKALAHARVGSAVEVRGTGCLFSTACADALARGLGPEEAVRAAQGFVEAAVARAARVGDGAAQVDVAALARGVRPG